MNNTRLIFLASLGCTLLGLSACTIGYQPGSPEVKYSERSSEARALQVPPDLTDIGDTEQFIVPGTSSGALARNTLLPVFENIRFVRNGAREWLEIDATPEAVWPQLLMYLRQESIPVALSQPLTGLIATQWQKNGIAPKGSALKALISNTSSRAFQRVVFRLERSGQASRVFARSQTSSTQPELEAVDELVWPSNSDDPEQTSVVLQQLLVFLGLEEQKAKGIIGADAAVNVLDNATLVTASDNVELQVFQAYDVSFPRLKLALQKMGVKVSSTNKRTGLLRVDDPNARASSQYSFNVLPIHSAAVSVTISTLEGNRLDLSVATAILRELKEQLA